MIRGLHGGMRGAGFRLLAAAALLGACAPGPQTSRPLEAPAASPTFGRVEISAGAPVDAALARCLESAGGPSAARFEVEPQAAVSPLDPDHIVAAWAVRGAGIGALQAAASFDGGGTWSPPATLPFNACAGGPLDAADRASDPWVAIGPEGRVYVSGIAFRSEQGEDVASAVIVVASGDGGRTWDAPSVVTVSRSHAVYHDNTALAADPLHPGTAWVVTTRYEDDGYIGPAALARTADGGKTWSPVQWISPRVPGSMSDCPQIVIDPRTGHLFVFYTREERGAAMSFVRSEDGGESWSPPVSVYEGTPWNAPPVYPGTDKEIRIAEDIGHPAIDPATGRLFALFTNGSFTQGRSLQVGLVTSADAGRTWSPPLQVSDRAAPAAWRPALAIDAQGHIAVTWFAPTPGKSPQGDRLPVTVHLTEIRLQPDGTLTRGNDTVVDELLWTPSPRGAPYFLGDYNPLLAGREGFLPVYGRSLAEGVRIVIARKT